MPATYAMRPGCSPTHPGCCAMQPRCDPTNSTCNPMYLQARARRHQRLPALQAGAYGPAQAAQLHLPLATIYLLTYLLTC
eukprot:scaffold61176_cov65-Phaeocystis_antarctica.AAC.1